MEKGSSCAVVGNSLFEGTVRKSETGVKENPLHLMHFGCIEPPNFPSVLSISRALLRNSSRSNPGVEAGGRLRNHRALSEPAASIYGKFLPDSRLSGVQNGYCFKIHS
jgi:hypothetical protein